MDGARVDARVSTLPSVHGEKVVDPAARAGRAGCSRWRTSVWTRTSSPPSAGCCDARRAWCCITGPTGSGKTSTLYSALQEIHTPDRNIVTLEDPVEVQIPG